MGDGEVKHKRQKHFGNIEFQVVETQEYTSWC